VNNLSYLNELLNSNLHVSFNPTCNKCTNANLLFDNILIEFTDFIKKHTNSNILVNNIKSHIYSNNNKNKLSYNFQCNLPNISLSSKFNLKIMYQNVRGLRTKLHDVISNFPILNYDIFLLTETWLSSDIVDAELGFTGFTAFVLVWVTNCTGVASILYRLITFLNSWHEFSLGRRELKENKINYPVYHYSLGTLLQLCYFYLTYYTPISIIPFRILYKL